eukprot:5322449-Amphidinium_carterae.1
MLFRHYFPNRDHKRLSQTLGTCIKVNEGVKHRRRPGRSYWSMTFLHDLASKHTTPANMTKTATTRHFVHFKVQALSLVQCHAA